MFEWERETEPVGRGRDARPPLTGEDAAKGGFPLRMGAAGAGTTRLATKLDEGANAATAANWHDNPDSQTRGMLGFAVKLTRERWAMQKADVNVLRFWA